MKMFKRLENWLKERNLDTKKYDHLTLLGYLHEEIDEGIKKRDIEHESVDWRTDCVVFLINSLYQDGYNPKICMEECLKEIEERTGEYSNEKRKFIKHEGYYTKEEAVDKLYEKYKCDKDSIKLTSEDDKFWYFSVNNETLKIKKWYKANFFKALRNDINNKEYIVKCYKFGKTIAFRELNTNNEWQVLTNSDFDFKKFEYMLID